jgi:hypothetical protein
MLAKIEYKSDVRIFVWYYNNLIEKYQNKL